MPEHLHAFGSDGTRLYVRTAGEAASAPTALFSDGIACDGFIWKYLWDEVQAILPVAHWNYRGHGRSAMPADPAHIELADHAQDLDNVRRAVGDPDVVLFGHSMGCQVALEACRIRRGGVRGLVLVCGSSGRITHTFRGTDLLADMLPGLIAWVERNAALVRGIWGRIPPETALRLGKYTGDFDTGSVVLDDLIPYLTHIVDIDLPMFLRMLRSAGEHSAKDLLPQLDVPALVIAGDKDSFTPPEYAEELAASLPQGELLMLRGATHVAPLERREVVRQRIERFVREKVLAG
jgi:pimeloyl-ACP methyl ester carboxylesterase